MDRVHLFEWEDFPWFPGVLRDAATAYLRRAVEVTGIAEAFAPKLLETVRATKAERIIDLCSGGAGPVVVLAKALADAGAPVPFVLTDLFPNVAAMAEAKRVAGARLDFVADSVDATAVPAALSGMRTLFNAFHHFRPGLARAILGNAVASRQPIAVFEIVNREPLTMLGIALSPGLVFLLMPTIRPVRPAWLLLTYVLPALPLLVFWDGLVSCLRVYSPDELRALVKGLPENDFRWEIGQIPIGPTQATYLVGTPPPVSESLLDDGDHVELRQRDVEPLP